MTYPIAAMDPAYFELIAQSDADDERAHAQERQDRITDFSPCPPMPSGAQPSVSDADGAPPSRSRVHATGRAAGAGSPYPDEEAAATLPRPTA